MTRVGLDVLWPLSLTLEEVRSGALRWVYFARRDALCSHCEGEGTSRRAPCPECQGTGGLHEPRKLEVRIPPGLGDWARIKVVGEGLPAPDGARGDLTFVCFVGPHRALQVSGKDTLFTAEVSRKRAGDRLVVPTLEGETELVLPAAVEDGQEFVLPGMGLPMDVEGKTHGDEIVRIRLVDKPDEPETARDAVSAAKELVAAGEIDRAESTLINFLRREPDSQTVLRALAGLMRQTGRHFEALHYLERLLNVNKASAYGHRELKEVLPLVFAPEQAGVRQAQPAAPAGESGAAERAFSLAHRRYYGAAARHFEQMPGCELYHAWATWLQGVTYDWDKKAEALELLEAGAGKSAQWQALYDFALRTLTWEHGGANRLMLARHLLQHGKVTEAITETEHALEGLRLGGGATSLDANLALSLIPDMEELFASANAKASPARSVYCEGLVELLRCAAMRRLKVPWERSFAPAVRAVEKLLTAVHADVGHDPAKRLLHKAAGEFDGVAQQMLAGVDYECLQFFQNTRDAILQRLVPHSSLLALGARDTSTGGLWRRFGWAYQALFAGRAALKGEFLVEAFRNSFVLTNYRLLELLRSRGGSQLIPLNVVERYTVVPAGIGSAHVTVDLKDGRRLVWTVASRTVCPSEQEVNYLLAARMWRLLGEEDVKVLSAGKGRGRPSVPLAIERVPEHVVLGAGTDAERLALVSGERCLGCGAPVMPGDAYCRQCGRPTKPPLPAEERKVLPRKPAAELADNPATQSADEEVKPLDTVSELPERSEGD